MVSATRSRLAAGVAARDSKGVWALTEESFGSQHRVTMGDVARRAGVSRALVSIVMRDARGASEETRRRVLAAAEELGYRPDVRAQSLAGQRSRVIGVMFGVSVGEFHFELLDGLYAAADATGHNLIISPLTSSRDEATAARSLQGFRFDALVMLSPPTPVPLLAGRIPLAVVGWHVDHPQVDVVRTDDDEGIRAAVDHLVDLGHRDIAHIDGGATLIADARRRAYVDAMRARGLADRLRIEPGGQSQVDALVPRTTTVQRSATQCAGRLQRRHRRRGDGRLRPAGDLSAGGHLGRRLRRQRGRRGCRQCR